LQAERYQSDIVDVYPKEIKNVQVDVNFNNIKQAYGKKIETETIKKILYLWILK